MATIIIRMATINVATLSGEHCTTNFTAYDYVYVAIWGRGRFCALLFCHYWKTAFAKAAISHTIMALQFLNGGGGGGEGYPKIRFLASD